MKKVNQTKWTSAMESELFALGRKNYTAEVIANMMNGMFNTKFTRNSIIAKMTRMRKGRFVKNPEMPLAEETIAEFAARTRRVIWTDTMKEQLRALNSRGLTTAQIALEINKKFGTSVNASSVSSARVKLKIEPKDQQLTARNLTRPKPPKIISAPVQSEFTHSLLDLKNSQCHYTDNGAHFCGEQAAQYRSYCKKHKDLCYAAKTTASE